MGIFSRLGNLGKGMWQVKTGGSRADRSAQADRLRTLQEELERTGGASGQRNTHGSAGTAAASLQTPQARLDALADDLRAGNIDREAYDRACTPIIAQLEGTDRMAAPAPADAAADPSADSPGTPLKRTL